jgi:NTP pyrophosphatase (non-canonical NTP hydrolase)
MTHKDITAALNELAAICHAEARQRGFWDKERNFGETLMLIVTELAEACEAARHRNPPSEYLDGIRQVEEELADALIRIMDWCGGTGIKIGDVVFAKMAYNRTRERMHGKAF